MDSPVIQLRFKGRVVQTLAFEGEMLRIGRMKENDIVINNVSVSRFHAVLKRDDGRVILEDSGSENGCYVNGTRIAGSVELEPGDEIVIGKHQLVVIEGDGEEASPSAAVSPGKSDVWDASKTYFVTPETQAKMIEDSRSASLGGRDPGGKQETSLPPQRKTDAEEDPAEDAEALDDAAVTGRAAPPIEAAAPDLGEDAAPDPIGIAAEDLEEAAPAGGDAAEEDEADESASHPDLAATTDDSPFDFGVDDDLVSSASESEAEVVPGDYDVELIDEEPEEDDEPAVDLDEPLTAEAEAPGEPILYAGLIIQKRGKLDRIISWDQDQLVAGRSRECEIFLEQPEISRRHALFVREDGSYHVRDLDSINGLLVNGEKTRDCRLALGDVVKIEDFEITFLLDRQPIASEIKTDELVAPVGAEEEGRFKLTMIEESLPISSGITGPRAAGEPRALVEEEAAALPEGSLFGPDEDKGERLVELEVMPSPTSEDEGSVSAALSEGVVSFELRIRLEDLPERLRTAIADVGEGDLRLPVEIVLKNDG